MKIFLSDVASAAEQQEHTFLKADPSDQHFSRNSNPSHAVYFGTAYAAQLLFPTKLSSWLMRSIHVDRTHLLGHAYHETHTRLVNPCILEITKAQSVSQLRER